AQSKDWAFCFICCLSVSDSLSRTNSPGADLNVAKQRPEGWRAGKPAINGQAPNQSEARPHRRAFCVFVGTQSGLTDRCDRASRTDVTRNPLQDGETGVIPHSGTAQREIHCNAHLLFCENTAFHLSWCRIYPASLYDALFINIKYYFLSFVIVVINKAKNSYLYLKVFD
ncbi:TPA: hypothetical protein ACTW06_004735, partial [Raoultella ornithinolytica]